MSLNSREMAKCDICEENIAASAKMVGRSEMHFLFSLYILNSNYEPNIYR